MDRCALCKIPLGGDSYKIEVENICEICADVVCYKHIRKLCAENGKDRLKQR